MERSHVVIVRLGLALSFASGVAFGQAQLYQVVGTTPPASLGRSLAAIGDLTGDGVSELAIGAPSSPTAPFGGARVVSGATGATVLTVTGSTSVYSNQLGYSICATGDLNGDGVPDFAAGGPISNPPFVSGYVNVYSGANGAVLLQLSEHKPTIAFGGGVAGPGDVNGDGVPDLWIGAPHDYTLGAKGGKVSLRSGVDGAVLHSLAAAADSYLGHSVAAPGDLDGDGVADLAARGKGFAQAYSGASGAVLYTWPISDFYAINPYYGNVAAADDVDLDGTPDVLVGTPGVSTQANVYSGATGVLLHKVAAYDNGHLYSGSAGAAVGSAGDVDADGTPDVLLGAPTHTQDKGAALVMSGRTGHMVYAIKGQAAIGYFGAAVAGPGDVDGDGYADIAVGAHGTNSAVGAAHVFRGYSVPTIAAADALWCGIAGTTVIEGANFEPGSTVSVAGVAAPVLAQSSTELVVQLGPGDPGVQPITVTNALGSTTQPLMPRLPIAHSFSYVMPTCSWANARLTTGGEALYVVAVSGGVWSTPLPLGPSIAYGLLLDAPVIVKIGFVAPGVNEIGLGWDFPSQPGPTPTSIYLQAYVQRFLPGGPPLEALSSVAAASISPCLF